MEPALSPERPPLIKDCPICLSIAIQNEGFSLVDIWELCTAYYVPNNRFNKSALDNTLAELNFETGLLHQVERPEYSCAYRASVAAEKGKTTVPVRGVVPKYCSSLNRRLECVIAGAAGKKINSAASLFCRGAVLAGLYATQRNDYPVTVQYGHSVSEVILSPQEIGYTEIVQPQIMIALFKEGLGEGKSAGDGND